MEISFIFSLFLTFYLVKGQGYSQSGEYIWSTTQQSSFYTDSDRDHDVIDPAAFLTPKWSTCPRKDKICKMEPLEIIRYYGYDVDTMTVETADGYLLSLWRVENRSCSENARNAKVPVLIQHGLGCSAADWLYLHPKSILPLMLADKCFPVFLGNSRGSKYSMGHRTLNSSSIFSRYWKYSAHEMGTEDLPAVIDAVLNVTQQKKLNYVGYSMGGSQFFILMSERQAEYMPKVNRFVALSPAFFIGNFHGHGAIFKRLMTNNITKPLLLTLGDLIMQGDGPVGEQFPLGGPLVYTFLRALLPLIVPPAQQVEKLIGTLGLAAYLQREGPLVKNKKAFRRAFAHGFPSGMSRRLIRHYMQMIKTHKFKPYQEVWEKRAQPEYRISNWTVPTLVLFGEDDTLVTPEDVERIFVNTCPSFLRNCSIPCSSHLDFVYGPSVSIRENVYDPLIEWFQWVPGVVKEVCPGNRHGKHNEAYCRSTVEYD